MGSFTPPFLLPLQQLDYNILTFISYLEGLLQLDRRRYLVVEPFAIHNKGGEECSESLGVHPIGTRLGHSLAE